MLTLNSHLVSFFRSLFPLVLFHWFLELAEWFVYVYVYSLRQGTDALFLLSKWVFDGMRLQRYMFLMVKSSEQTKMKLFSDGVCPSVCPSVCLSVCLFVRLFVWLVGRSNAGTQKYKVMKSINSAKLWANSNCS